MPPVKLIKSRLIQCPLILLAMRQTTSPWERNVAKGPFPLQEGKQKGWGNHHPQKLPRKPSTKRISDCRVADRATHERDTRAEYKPYVNSQMIGPQPRRKAFGFWIGSRDEKQRHRVSREHRDLRTGPFSHPAVMTK